MQFPNILSVPNWTFLVAVSGDSRIEACWKIYFTVMLHLTYIKNQITSQIHQISKDIQNSNDRKNKYMKTATSSSKNKNSFWINHIEILLTLSLFQTIKKLIRANRLSTKHTESFKQTFVLGIESNTKSWLYRKQIKFSRSHANASNFY